MAKKVKKTSATSSLLVSFRLPNDAVAAELAAQAQAAGQPSPSLFARELVVGALLRPDEVAHKVDQMAERLQNLDRTLKEVKRLREDLATSVQILLVEAGKLTPEQAKFWIEKNLGNFR